ncbi:DNA mismatch repair protein MutS2 [Enterococcus faecium]|nr:DNA mismatch repair protein MutS2 [Enterococcus faecium]
MDNEMISQLQFDQIKKEIQARAIGNYSKKRISDMTVSTNLQTVLDRQEETREARLILESSQHVPFMGLPRIDALTEQVKKGLILQPTDLIEYADFLRSSRMITKFFDKNQYQTPLLFAYSKHLPDLINVEELIDQKIKNNKVSDDASRNLRKVRKQLQLIEKEIQSKLLKFLRHPKNKEIIQEAMIVQKGEYYTIPIKASYKNKIDGTIIDESNKRTTVFIEPTVISKLNERYQLLKAEEISEEYQVLAALTGAIAENEEVIDLLIETITVLDIMLGQKLAEKSMESHLESINQNISLSSKADIHFYLSMRYHWMLKSVKTIEA